MFRKRAPRQRDSPLGKERSNRNKGEVTLRLRTFGKTEKRKNSTSQNEKVRHKKLTAEDIVIHKTTKSSAGFANPKKKKRIIHRDKILKRHQSGWEYQQIVPKGVGGGGWCLVLGGGGVLEKLKSARPAKVVTEPEN